MTSSSILIRKEADENVLLCYEILPISEFQHLEQINTTDVKKFVIYV